jgi:cyanate permease
MLFSVRVKKEQKISKIVLQNIGLNNMEKQLLTNLLRNDAGVGNSDPTPSTRISWRQIRYVFIDWRIYLYSLITLGGNTVIKCLTTFLPSLVEAMGYSKTTIHLMTAPPYAIACVFCLLVGYSSSRRNEHSYHLAFSLIVSLLGFILVLTLFDHGKAAVYVATTIGLCGSASAFSLILAWLTINVGGRTKRAMAISFVISLGQIGSINMPLVRALLV